MIRYLLASGAAAVGIMVLMVSSASTEPPAPTVVMITEDVDDDPRYLSGRFSAELVEKGTLVESGPTGVSLADALKWGRQRSSQVVVQLDDKWYSAGEDDPRDIVDRLPPDLAVPRRPLGSSRHEAREALDWYVTIHFASGRDAEAARAVGAALRDAIAVIKVTETGRPTYDSVRYVVTIPANHQAADVVHQALYGQARTRESRLDKGLGLSINIALAHPADGGASQ